MATTTGLRRAGLKQNASLEPSRVQVGRFALLGVPFVLAAVFIAYMATRVPVKNIAEAPVLTGGAIVMHWAIAAGGLGIVLAVDAIVIGLSARARRAEPSPSVHPRRGLPEVLTFQRVPRWGVLSTGLISGVVLIGAVALGLPLWQRALAALIPWLPVFVVEEGWKYRRYGFFAVFLGLAVLQVGHLGEHGAQVIQLLLSDGNLARSHGVFGQLDFESVHFVWDTAVWMGGGVLVYRFRGNRWLLLSWIVASVHQVEHIYLFWLNQLHPDFWAHGGIFGIFGQGGLIGSPLSRPYLHFAYNFLVVVPMLVGLWDEARRVPEDEPGSASHRSGGRLAG